MRCLQVWTLLYHNMKIFTHTTHSIHVINLKAHIYTPVLNDLGVITERTCLHYHKRNTCKNLAANHTEIYTMPCYLPGKCSVIVSQQMQYHVYSGILFFNSDSGVVQSGWHLHPCADLAGLAACTTQCRLYYLRPEGLSHQLWNITNRLSKALSRRMIYIIVSLLT